jgi:hypothetical protein
MSVIMADIMSGMVPVIVEMAHSEDRADDHGCQDHQDRQAWDKVHGHRSLAIPASGR